MPKTRLDSIPALQKGNYSVPHPMEGEFKTTIVSSTSVKHDFLRVAEPVRGKAKEKTFRAQWLTRVVFERDALDVLRLVRSVKSTFAPINRIPPEVLSLTPGY